MISIKTGERICIQGTDIEVENDLANLMLALMSDDRLMSLFVEASLIVNPKENPAIRAILNDIKKTKEVHVLS